MFLAVMARLKPGVTIEQATAEMRVLDRSSRRGHGAHFNNNPQWLKARLDVEPAGAGTSILRENLSRPLLALMAMVAVLLLLACVNIASLLLARGAAREREMSLRVAVGASRLQDCRVGRRARDVDACQQQEHGDHRHQRQERPAELLAQHGCTRAGRLDIEVRLKPSRDLEPARPRPTRDRVRASPACLDT